MDFLSLDDFKNTKADPKWSAFDYLLEVLSLDDFKNICSALKDNPWGRKAPSTISMAIATGYRKGKGKGRAGENMARRREVPLPWYRSLLVHPHRCPRASLDALKKWVDKIWFS
ncbi:hypothetical protein V6N13_142726 [Hibiscus sabdariffa]